MVSKIKNMFRSQLYKVRGKLDYNTWIFSSVDNNNFNYNSKYLFLFVKEHLPQIRPLFVINDQTKREGLAMEYGAEYFIDTQSKEGLVQVLKAGVWFTSAGLPAYEWSGHPDRIVVNLWHGIPLKKIVLMEEHFGTLQKLYFRRIFSRKYTDILTTSEKLIPIMARSFGVSKHVIKVWGQPRNDAILQGYDREELKKRAGMKEGGSERLLLYAPTYRDSGPTRLFPFADYDKEELESFLKEKNCHICIRMHLEERVDEKEFLSEHIHFINEDVIDDIAQWMGCFDLLVTDYSSIYLDYLLLDRPMLFLPYDKEEYLRSRGMNYSYDKVTPGPKPSTQKEFLYYIEEFLAGRDSFGKHRKQCNRYFNQVNGMCCQTITEHILERIRKR